jgi:hypothetical protein
MRYAMAFKVEISALAGHDAATGHFESIRVEIAIPSTA